MGNGAFEQLSNDQVAFIASYFVYELYKVDWVENHISPQRRTKAVNEYLSYRQECERDGVGCEEYMDWIEEYGFDGELFASYDEFMDAEYHDRDYIRYLISSQSRLFKLQQNHAERICK